MVSPKLMLYAVTKDECNIKEDTGKCMKNVLYVVRKQTSSQSVENSIK